MNWGFAGGGRPDDVGFAPGDLAVLRDMLPIMNLNINSNSSAACSDASFLSFSMANVTLCETR
jgi:hypothetical protein